MCITNAETFQIGATNTGVNKGKAVFAPHTLCEQRDAVLACQCAKGRPCSRFLFALALFPSQQRSRAHLINSSEQTTLSKHGDQFTRTISKHADQNTLPPCSHMCMAHLLKISWPEVCVFWTDQNMPPPCSHRLTSSGPEVCLVCA